MVMAYEGLDQPTNAQRIREESKYLFPNYDIDEVISKFNAINTAAESAAVNSMAEQQ
jgi:hypothetical protein